MIMQKMADQVWLDDYRIDFYVVFFHEPLRSLIVKKKFNNFAIIKLVSNSE